jgi:hypothetical protein
VAALAAAAAGQRGQWLAVARPQGAAVGGRQQAWPIGYAWRVLTLERPMSRHHTQLIRSIFHDPPPHNLHWRDVEALLRHVGAQVEPISGARVRVTLNRMEEVLHRPHGDEVDRQSVLHVRAFLGRAGVTPAAFEHTGDKPARPDTAG